jgi:3-deoxy-D-manno-octulosonic-acid transferase
MANAALWLYSALTWAAQPLLRRKLHRRAVAEPGYGRAIGERFGRYTPACDSLAPASSASAPPRWVWVHAVSLGETRAAAILLAALRRQMPGMRLLLTHGTATGRAEGEKLLQPGDVQVWQPWDTPAAVARFLRQFRPAIGILMETEVWPNLVAGCRQHGIPLVLANARFNEKSLRKALRLSALARPAYSALAAVWAQTGADAERLRAIGAPVRGVFGNLKFDLVPDAAQIAQGRAWRGQSARPVVMLASSREGEEAMWLENFKQYRPEVLAQTAHSAIKTEASKVQWLIVPRHPQRFDEVAQLLHNAGLRVSRRSRWEGAPEPADVWLGDSLGEMALYYGLADVALLGGSFAPLGGQNLIEAAACGCPVVLGPHTFNFAEAADLACAAGAAQRVADLGQGMDAACTLALDAQRLAAAQNTATQFASAHRGAAQATAAAVAHIVGGCAGG